ncbi:unnamed protein product [Enterobius vermicularis]|uniref:C-type lectin domain-containing protein n=1 Tax=Enterobius vermicularis TaxID=51028 RepID=A0A0N4UYT2_ENTVE|nr:unnamed protein product [Enterobius vermicularis]
MAVAFVSELKSVEQERSCPKLWFEFEGRCYYHIKSKLSAHKAWEKCRRHWGSDLVSIHDRYLNEFIANLEEDGLLIGLYYNEGKNAYQWTDETPVDFVSSGT